MLTETRPYMIYPNKSIIEDLIDRDGPATEDSFTPFDGKQEVIAGQFSGTQKYKFKRADFLKHNRNRDLDPSRINATAEYGMLVESTNDNAGYRTLEDMMVNGKEVKGVEDYIIMLCVGYKKDNTSPYRANQDYLTRTVRNIDGEDDAVEEKYLQNKVVDYISNTEYEDIIRELPYIMKSIWSYSKLYQANLFSFALAYWDIVQTKNRSPIINDFVNYTTYLIGKDGSYKRQFSHADDNKYVIYPAVTKIFIAPGEHRAEFNLCLKWLHMLVALGIDYRDEDPMVYNNEFINNIVCKYLPTNEQYIEEYKELDAEIIIALNPENIFTTTKAGLYTPKEESPVMNYRQAEFFIGDRILMAYKIGELPMDFFEEQKEVAYEILGEVLCALNGNNPVDVPRHLVSFEKNGIMYMNKGILTIPGKLFGKFKGRTDYNVAITKYGFVVALEESFDDVYYKLPEDTLKALEDFKEYGKVQEETDWKVL